MPKAAPPVQIERLLTDKELEQLLNDALREPSIWKKGKKFEIFFENIMAREKEFQIVDKHCRSKLGEIDYIYSHELHDAFWRLSPYICIECKNWTGKIDSVQMDHFVSLVKSKNILCCCGVYVTSSSYERSAFESVEKAKTEHILIVPIEGKHLKELIKEGFKELVRKLGQEIVFKK